MGWALVDDGFFSHPKVAQLMCDSRQGSGLQAVGLWVLALSWAYRHTVDKSVEYQGAIPARILDVWNRNWDGGIHEAAEQLVSAELWDRVDLGSCQYRIHDFRHWARLDARDASRRGGRASAARRWGTPIPGVDEALSNPQSNGNDNLQNSGTNPPTPNRTDKPFPLNGGSADEDRDFTTFYKLYPRRKEPREARKAWDKAIKRADPQTIIAGAIRYAQEREGQDPKLTKYPASWLNKDCWADEPDPELDTGGKAPWEQ